MDQPSKASKKKNSSKELKKQTSLKLQDNFNKPSLNLSRHLSAQLDQQGTFTNQFSFDPRLQWIQDQQSQTRSTGVTQSHIYETKRSEIMDDMYDQQQLSPGLSPQIQSQYPMARSQIVYPQFKEDPFDNKQRSSTMKTDELKFKTELCKNWEETGKCNYGGKCQFAHGRHELQVNPSYYVNQRYKSKYCKQFHVQEFCLYGSRCMFMHEVRTIKEIQEGVCYQKYLSNITLDIDSFCSVSNFQPIRRDVFNHIAPLKKVSSVWDHSVLILESQEEQKSSDEY